MFGVPVVKHGINGELRQKGKIAELALGYGGSVGAMVAMGALEKGLMEDELKLIVDSWRQANPKIVQLWWEVDKAVMTAMKEKKPTRVKCFTFHYESGFLIASLPSGRQLFYAKPRIEKNKYDRDSLTYEEVGAGKRWERIETYGPKLVENCLAEETTVLTDHGLIPIQKVTYDMRIWDGEEWVRHEGLLYKGNKEVINVDDYVTLKRSEQDILNHYNTWYPTYVNFIEDGESIEIENFDEIEAIQREILSNAKKYLKRNTEYFSFLRPLNELQIAKAF
jgi:hypothetical protein